MRRYLLGFMSIALFLISMNSFSEGMQDQGNAGGDYPRRPIEIVVPFGAGGSSDLMSRQVAQIMENYVDVPVNVINKPGGGGIDGMVYAKNTPADGYTMFQVTPSHAIATALERPNANLLDDFAPIGNFQVDIVCFGVSKSSPIENFEDMVAYAKENPGKLKIGGTSPAAWMTILSMVSPEKLV